MNFVSVYEDEFKAFYDKYFSRYTQNDEGLLIIKLSGEDNELLQMHSTVFIYWLLTTDNTNGIWISIQYSAETYVLKLIIQGHKVVIEYNLFRESSSTTHEQGYINLKSINMTTSDIIINSAFTISEQIIEINRVITSNFLEILNHFFSSSIVIDISELNDLITDNGDVKISLRPDTFKYFTGGDLIDGSTIHQHIYSSELVNIKPNQYYILKDPNFAIIVNYLDQCVERTFTDMSYDIQIKWHITVVPLNYYYHTLGYDLDILHGYCTIATEMIGLAKWAQDKFQYASDQFSCEELKNVIISEFLSSH